MPEEKVYIGTKIVKATPMDRATFVVEKSGNTQKIEESENEHGYKVTYEDGYTSWSPAATFDRAYREVTGAEKAMIG